jgi:peptide deformylase
MPPRIRRLSRSKTTLDEQIEAVQAELAASERQRKDRAHALGFRPPIVWPDPRLTTEAAPVHAADLTALAAYAERPGQALLDDSTQALLELLRCIAFTAERLDAAGLAAPQIGVPLRVFVVRVRDPGSPATTPAPGTAAPAPVPGALRALRTVHLINPVLVEATGRQTTAERCLSLPGQMIPVERANFVRMTYFDADGAECEIGGDGLLAVQLQHEFDHLQGRLIIDTLSQLRRSLVRKDLSDRKRNGLRYELPRDPEPAPVAAPAAAPAAPPVLP